MNKEERQQLTDKLKAIVLSMPDKPGSYQFYVENHTIIYVGKS